MHIDTNSLKNRGVDDGKGPVSIDEKWSHIGPLTIDRSRELLHASTSDSAGCLCIMRLPARKEDSLVWELDPLVTCQENILWELDLGLDVRDMDFFDEIAFQGHLLALEHFVSTCWLPHKEKSVGVVIYRGKLDIEQRSTVNSIVDALSCMQTFGEYIHRLVAYLPEELAIYCLFEEDLNMSSAMRAHLLSKERFPYVHVALETSARTATTGICLPQDQLCSPASIERLDALLQSVQEDVRIIPEALLTDEWEGLEKIICLEGCVSDEGKRKLRGFELSGGAVLFW